MTDQSLSCFKETSHLSIPAEQFPDNLVVEDIEMTRGKRARRTALIPTHAEVEWKRERERERERQRNKKDNKKRYEKLGISKEIKNEWTFTFFHISLMP